MKVLLLIMCWLSLSAEPMYLQDDKDKRTERGYWLMQDELDCADNIIQ